MNTAHPADEIVDEHRVIARMLEVLHTLAQVIDRGEPFALDDVAETVHFFREFVDLGHHEKEESVLIPELTRAGVDWSSGALAEIRAEHNQERYLVRSLRHATLQHAEWTAEERKHFASIATEFVELQRKHLARENAEMIPLARQKLSADRVEAVRREFSNIDSTRRASGVDVDVDSLASRILG
ncbi:MAG: hemerythrin domain-containing protein [Polyangiaceae bacterium]